MNDEKYVVFKAGEFRQMMMALRLEVSEQIAKDIEGRAIKDAVVIRRQDVFAPPALDAYANSIMAAIETLKVAGVMEDDVQAPAVDRLRDIADYFHAQAVAAWVTDRKIPD